METLNYSRRRRRAVATAIATATATAIHLLDASATTMCFDNFFSRCFFCRCVSLGLDTVTFEKEPMPSIPASSEENVEKQSFSSKNNFSSHKASSKYDFIKVKISNHVAIKIALELKKLLIDNSLLDVYELFGNYFSGSIPEWIGQKKNLRFLDFSQNLFYDTIPIRERLKDKLEEFFNCQYKHFVEFTALNSWRRGANIGWHSDDNRPYLKQRHFAVVCYLNNYGKDFNGGLFYFQDGQPMSIMLMAELKIQIPPLLPEGERVFKGCVSASELELMELFEDYTCMICHCPNPRNTHIFGNCIIQSTTSVSPKLDASTRYPSHSFLTVCFLCNKNLGHGKDIYMYRYKRVNLEGQAVKLNRAKLEACLTCPLCNKLFNNATTIFECLHTFCRGCIDKKLIDEQLKHCRVCNADLGCSPLDKLRYPPPSMANFTLIITWLLFCIITLFIYILLMI